MGGDGNLWFTEIDGDAIGRITPQGVITEFPLPSPASRPIGITAGPDGNVWFTELLGKIGRITPSGTVSEFTEPSVGFFIVSGPGMNLWFTADGGIGRIATNGQKHVFEFENVARVHVDVGPDDAPVVHQPPELSDRQHDPRRRAPRDSTAILETEAPQFITRGPEDNLWFTAAPGTIGRVNQAGTIEHPHPG